MGVNMLGPFSARRNIQSWIPVKNRVPIEEHPAESNQVGNQILTSESCRKHRETIKFLRSLGRFRQIFFPESSTDRSEQKSRPKRSGQKNRSARDLRFDPQKRFRAAFGTIFLYCTRWR